MKKECSKVLKESIDPNFVRNRIIYPEEIFPKDLLNIDKIHFDHYRATPPPYDASPGPPGPVPPPYDARPYRAIIHGKHK